MPNNSSLHFLPTPSPLRLPGRYCGPDHSMDPSGLVTGGLHGDLNGLTSDTSDVPFTNAGESPPINRLPSNILSAIFSLVPARWNAPQRKRFPTCVNIRDLRQLEPVLATCRYWRFLATTTPSLWSTVLWTDSLGPGVGGASRRGDYLSFCSSGPLHVYIRVTDSSSASLGKLKAFLIAYSPRIEELHWDYSSCTFESPRDVALPRAIMELPFPALERCVLLHHNPDFRSRTLPILPNSPRLRTLQFHAASYIPSTSFPSLTHLSISAASSRSTLGNLLTLLENYPRLECLTVNDYTLDTSASVSLEGWSIDRGPVALPSLRMLFVNETHAIRLDLREEGQARISTFQRMLVAHLSIPHFCETFLGVLEADDLVPIAQSLFGSIPAARAAQMHFHTARPSRLGDAVGWTISLADAYGTLAASFKFAHVIPVAQDPRAIAKGAEAAQATLRAAFSSLPVFSGVRGLFVRANMLWGLRSPYSILPAFGQLESLTIFERLATTPFNHPEDDYAVTKAILRPLEVTTGAGPIACPQLTTLLIDTRPPPNREDGAATSLDDAYTERGACSPVVADGGGSPSFREMLAYVEDVVRARGEAGHPLTRVIVRRSALGQGSTQARVVAAYEYSASGAWHVAHRASWA